MRNRLHQARTVSRKIDVQGLSEIELPFKWPKVTRQDGQEPLPAYVERRRVYSRYGTRLLRLPS